MSTGSTIFAASTGAPPAAIAVIRISGASARDALALLCGDVPPPRLASLRTLRDAAGEVLDRALVLWFPGLRTATGEDVVELHCHGGRAVVAAVEATLGSLPDLRRANPGEFTRRAFANGRLDLAEVEGLADLLVAETELERRHAVLLAGGSLSRAVADWRERLLSASAAIEALLDFADEDTVTADFAEPMRIVSALLGDIRTWLDRPHAELLRNGLRVVLAGEPNSGKSTLFNALVGAEAAITAPTAGTTRDVLDRTVAVMGVPMTFVDVAGLHDAAADPVEAIGIDRAREEINRADIVMWLGEAGRGPVGSWEIETQIDREDHHGKAGPRHRVSALTGAGIDAMLADLVGVARMLLPKPGESALNQRQRCLLSDAAVALSGCSGLADPLLIAEHLRLTRRSFDELTGQAGTEEMLDALFERFCVGK